VSSVKITSQLSLLTHFAKSELSNLDLPEKVEIWDTESLINLLHKNQKPQFSGNRILFSISYRPYVYYLYSKYEFNGVILGHYPVEEYRKALEKVSVGDNFLLTDMIKKIYDKKISGYYDNLLSLTQSEISIIKLMLRGNKNNEIAETLQNSIRTVENHKYKIFRKLEINTGIELMQRLNDYAPWLLPTE
jgi:DNA-binding NarL/FixJ family response regulator